MTPRDDVVAGLRLGVERICAVLQVAPSGYYEFKNRQPSARDLRDSVMEPRGASAVGGQLPRLWVTKDREGGAACWSRHRQGPARRAGGIEGVRRSKRVRTTKPVRGMPRHPDLVRRDFTATAPNQLGVTDLTFVPTWDGVANVCFIIDAYSRSIVGWRVASHMRTTMVLNAIEMARWSRGTQLTGLRCHSDAGSQFTSVRYGERLA